MAAKGIQNNCPYCGKTIRVKRYKAEHAYGSPVRACEHCGKTYIDRYYRELALEDPGSLDRRKITPKNIGMLLFGSLVIILAGFLFPEQKDLMIKILLMALGALLALSASWVIITEYTTYGRRMQFFDEERAASEQRLSDPAYALKLKNAGFIVPERYL